MAPTGKITCCSQRSNKMAWFGAVLGLASGAMQADATKQGGVDAYRTGVRNYASLMEASRETSFQAYEDEAAQRREATLLQGRQAAAVGQAGIGSGGTAGTALRQSAVLAELDALNIRYGGQQKSKNLRAQADEELRQGKAGKKAANKLAGAQLLGTVADTYGSYRKIKGGY